MPSWSSSRACKSLVLGIDTLGHGLHFLITSIERDVTSGGRYHCQRTAKARKSMAKIQVFEPHVLLKCTVYFSECHEALPRY